MRNRAWRRYKKELSIIKRLKVKVRYYINDDNDIVYDNPSVRQFIGTYEYLIAKTYSTTKCDSRYKDKYSPNRRYCYSRSSSQDINKRETNKVIFIKILKNFENDKY